MLEQLLSEGIRYLFVSNSDNLGATLDTTLLAWFAASGKAFLMEVGAGGGALVRVVGVAESGCRVARWASESWYCARHLCVKLRVSGSGAVATVGSCVGLSFGGDQQENYLSTTTWRITEDTQLRARRCVSAQPLTRRVATCVSARYGCV